MAKTKTNPNPERAVVRHYHQKSIRARIEAFFLDNLGKVATREQLIEVARQGGGEDPENWHQRLSELRTDAGYTILSRRDGRSLKVGEYMMLTSEKRPGAAKRVLPTPATWRLVLERAKNSCEWDDDGKRCGLKHGEPDPVGGGTVRLTPDHMTPHSVNPAADCTDPKQWRALCGRHQVMKKISGITAPENSMFTQLCKRHLIGIKRWSSSS